MYCIVIGGGKIGTSLASTLAGDGNDIVIVEKNPDVANMLRADTSFLVLTNDGTEVSSLEAAGAEKADVLIAVTGDDNANLVAAQIAEYQFSIPNIVLGVNNQRNVEIFRELGMKKVVDRTSDAVNRILDSMHDLRASAIVANGSARVMEFEVENGSYADGSNIEKLYLPGDAVVGAVIRNDKIYDNERNFILKTGDAVIIIASVEDLKRIGKVFAKEGD